MQLGVSARSCLHEEGKSEEANDCRDKELGRGVLQHKRRVFIGATARIFAV